MRHGPGSDRDPMRSVLARSPHRLRVALDGLAKAFDVGGCRRLSRRIFGCVREEGRCKQCAYQDRKRASGAARRVHPNLRYSRSANRDRAYPINVHRVDGVRAVSMFIVSVVSVSVIIVPVMSVLVIMVAPVVMVRVFLVSFAFVLMLAMAAFIRWFVFRGSNEIYGSIAGVVFAAMLAPIFCVSRRHVQVEGRRRSELRLDQHRLRIHERRRTFIANLNLTVDTGRHLTREHDVNVQIARMRDAGNREQHRYH
jgi:hypothetical protein